jgi:hypothetical protein
MLCDWATLWFVMLYAFGSTIEFGALKVGKVYRATRGGRSGGIDGLRKTLRKSDSLDQVNSLAH